MTTQKKLKARVRARMEKTGERYAAARAAILGTLHRERPPRARHDQTFALHRVLEERGLSWHGVVPDEAWLLGLGGGLGAQVFTFQYTGAPPIVFVGTRCAHQYAYDEGFVVRALEGLGLGAEVRQTGSPKKACAQLTEALASGPAVVWVGREALHGEASPGGSTPWVVVVHQEHDGVFAIEDANGGTREVDGATLALARAAVKKAKHRVIVPSGVADRPVVDGVVAGVRWCAADLAGEHAVKGHGSRFGLGALASWADRVDRSTKNGWRAVFAPGRAWLGGMRQVYGWIEVATGGGAFRGMYAEFLRHAAESTGDPAWSEVADQADRCAAGWTAVADAALPLDVPLLGEVRAHAREAWPSRPDAAAALLDRVGEVPAAVIERSYGALRERLSELVAEERTLLSMLQERAA